MEHFRYHPGGGVGDKGNKKGGMGKEGLEKPPCHLLRYNELSYLMSLLK